MSSQRTTLDTTPAPDAPATRQRPPMERAAGSNGDAHRKGRHRHLRRGGLHVDLIAYPYLEMRKVGDTFVIPLPDSVPMSAMQVHTARVCRHMSEVLTANGYGKNVRLKATSDPERGGVRVRRVS